MGHNADFTIRNGDTSPTLEARLLRDETPIPNIRDATVAFEMQHTRTDERVGGLCTIIDSEDAHVGYIWNDRDTDTPGYYNAVFKVDYDIPESLSELDADETFPSDDFLRIEVTETL